MKALYFLLILILFSQPAHAYIDPGVGSMLFTVVLCFISSLCFLFRIFIFKIKNRFFIKKGFKEKKHDFVIYNEGNQYYSVFKPIVDEFEKRKIPLMIYTSSKDDKFLQESYNYTKCEFIGQGKKAYFRLAFLNADICLMTTPQLDVLQLRRSKNTKHYSHILHSIGFSMDYHLFGLDYYDSILCDAQFQIPLIKEIETIRNLKEKELTIVGSTYMDYNNNLIAKTSNEKYTILIAPSWGEHSLLNKMGFELLDSLSKTDYHIIIRPHPQTLLNDKKMIDALMEKYNNLEWDLSPNNIQALSRADVLISDFSCIVFDYAFLMKKPFLYVDTNFNLEITDCNDLKENKPWKYEIVDKIGKKINIKDISKIKDVIEEIKKDEKLLKNIENASHFAWEKRGQSAKNAVDFLIKKQLEIKDK